MPKTFPQPTEKEHPKGGSSLDHTAPLGDLLYAGASPETVARHLRDVRDEWSANILAQWLCQAVAAIPTLLRAVEDGKGKYREKLQVDELLSQFRRKGPNQSTPESLKSFRDAIAELQRESREYGQLSSLHNAATAALLDIRAFAPALLSDPRAKPADKATTPEQVGELRHELGNYFNEKRLQIEVDQAGWPKSINRRDGQQRRQVKLVTAPAGMRGTK